MTAGRSHVGSRGTLHTYQMLSLSKSSEGPWGRRGVPPLLQAVFVSLSKWSSADTFLIFSDTLPDLRSWLQPPAQLLRYHGRKGRLILSQTASPLPMHVTPPPFEMSSTCHRPQEWVQRHHKPVLDSGTGCLPTGGSKRCQEEGKTKPSEKGRDKKMEVQRCL